jgi:hypothetical protein
VGHIKLPLAAVSDNAIPASKCQPSSANSPPGLSGRVKFISRIEYNSTGCAARHQGPRPSHTKTK